MLKYISLLIVYILLYTPSHADIVLVDIRALIDKEIKCLADNIYFEARNESIKGRLAVALVTINRVESDKYPNNICSVVWEKNYSKKYKKWIAQFSWTLDGLSDVPKNDKAYIKAERMAEFLILSKIDGNYIADFTDGATHYHATYVSPPWAKRLVKLAKIDTHIFYKYKK